MRPGFSWSELEKEGTWTFGPGSDVGPEHPNYDASIGANLKKWKPKKWKLTQEGTMTLGPGSAVGTVRPDSDASLPPLIDTDLEEAARDQLTEEEEAARARAAMNTGVVVHCRVGRNRTLLTTPLLAAAALGHSLPGSAVGKKERKIDRKKNFWWRVVCKILKWREFQARYHVASRYLNSGPEGFNWNNLRPPKPKSKAKVKLRLSLNGRHALIQRSP